MGTRKREGGDTPLRPKSQFPCLPGTYPSPLAGRKKFSVLGKAELKSMSPRPTPAQFLPPPPAQFLAPPAANHRAQVDTPACPARLWLKSAVRLESSLIANEALHAWVRAPDFLVPYFSIVLCVYRHLQRQEKKS